MAEFKCAYCNKQLGLSGMVVSSSSGRLFCGTQKSHLESDSCAYRFLEENLGGFEEYYFYIKLLDNVK